MLSFADWTAQQNAPQSGGRSFNDWQSSQQPTAPVEQLSLPTFTYDSSGLVGEKRHNGLNLYETLPASSLLQDYYGQMTNSYLPSLDTFAKDNAGQMVAYDPDRFMSIEDFGLGTSRGDLRNQNLLQQSHPITIDNFAEGSTEGLWYQDDQGNYLPAWDASKVEGKELFNRTGEMQASFDNPDGTPVYASSGKFHTETPQEAIARLLEQGGGYASGGFRTDFMGKETFDDLLVDHSGKWGSDPVNNAELAQYLNDPNWVTRDENGNITHARAELYPLLMRESLGEEYRDMNRGGTKAAGGFGDVVKAAILGVVTGGLGLAGASALGMGTAAAGAGLGATAAGMGAGGLATAGAISGGLNSAFTGGDVLKGALTGGLTGGFSKFASPYVGNTLGNMGVTGTMNKALTGGLTSTLGGGLSSAITGGQFNPISSFASGATQGYMGSQSGKDMLGGIGITDPYLQRMAGSLASGTVGSLATGKNPNMQGMLANTGIKTFQQWLNDQSRG